SFHHVLEFLDRLLRRVHWDHRGGRHAIGEVVEVLGHEVVERAAGGAPRLRVLMERDAEARGRIEHGEVDPELVQPLIEQPWHQLGRAVESIARRYRPECLLRAMRSLALGGGFLERPRDVVIESEEPVDGALAAVLFQLLADDWREFEPVAIRVDYWMLQTSANFPSVGTSIGRHLGASISGLAWAMHSVR